MWLEKLLMGGERYSCPAYQRVSNSGQQWSLLYKKHDREDRDNDGYRLVYEHKDEPVRFIQKRIATIMQKSPSMLSRLDYLEFPDGFHDYQSILGSCRLTENWYDLNEDERNMWLMLYTSLDLVAGWLTMTTDH